MVDNNLRPNFQKLLCTRSHVIFFGSRIWHLQLPKILIWRQAYSRSIVLFFFLITRARSVNIVAPCYSITSSILSTNRFCLILLCVKCSLSTRLGRRVLKKRLSFSFLFWVKPIQGLHKVFVIVTIINVHSVEYFSHRCEVMWHPKI